MIRSSDRWEVEKKQDLVVMVLRPFQGREVSTKATNKHMCAPLFLPLWCIVDAFACSGYWLGVAQVFLRLLSHVLRLLFALAMACSSVVARAVWALLAHPVMIVPSCLSKECKATRESNVRLSSGLHLESSLQTNKYGVWSCKENHTRREYCKLREGENFLHPPIPSAQGAHQEATPATSCLYGYVFLSSAQARELSACMIMTRLAPHLVKENQDSAGKDEWPRRQQTERYREREPRKLIFPYAVHIRRLRAAKSNQSK